VAGSSVITHTVYGRFAPRSDERDRWQKIAAAQDKKKSELGTAVGYLTRDA